MSEIIISKSILSAFGLEGKIDSIKALGIGHIHQSLRLFEPGKEEASFLLQQINHQVFRDVPGLMNNIEMATSHIRSKLEARGASDLQRRVLAVRKTILGQNFYVDEGGSYWRIFDFIPNSQSVDQIQNADMAKEGGKAYGAFIRDLEDLAVNKFIETIPNFHHVGLRLDTFKEVIEKDPAGRLRECQSLVEEVNKRALEMQKLILWGEQGLLPYRLTHNDTKFNNVLLDDQFKALCVVDLDTVMPGFIAYDFGDAIRTGASTAAEDEAELDKVSLDLDIYAAFAEGFIEEVHAMLSQYEWESLAFGAKLMTFIMGLRFLTDFIAGDVYYQIHYPGQNIARAKSQFALLADMESKFEHMEKIIEALRLKISMENK